MATHAMPSKPSILARAAGGALVVGGLTLGAIAFSSATAPVEASAACGNGFSGFSNTGTNNPNTFNVGSGNNINTQFGFGGGNFGSFQSTRTGNNNSTNTGNTTTCTNVKTSPFGLPSAGMFNNTGTNNPNTFNVFSGNNINTQFSGFGPNVGGHQSSSTGNNDSTNIGNQTVSTNVGP
jgi:hypothetical protein